MLERHHLAILEATDRLGTLTQAANALCLTQSALSHGIKKLEGQLGVALWERDGRRLRLTAAGRHALAFAQRMLPQFADLENDLAQYAKGLQGSLRIGMECHPCYRWLVGVMQPFLSAWPKVDIDVRQRFQFGGLGALLGHDIDLLVTPDPVYKRQLQYTPVFDYELVLVVAANHRLADKTHVEPRDLGPETLFTYPVETARLDIFSQFLNPAGASVYRHTPLEATDVMLQLVANGRGITALPRWLVEEYQPRLSLKSLRLGQDGLFKQLFVGIRQSDRDVPYIQAFIQHARPDSVPLVAT
ncbi:LysR family transcriptional regulator [Aestuariibacter halophilus]|uniref:HTH-type transcriptional regulator MetR n=1 Tax=Fluctibacter halophilus TaxID=226011 RepID=A0ABS8G8S6_9ALTE|nr:LysR family transcriptional regulator [Aestuariibacter halophilus]MCC2616972.1 LysR family transcriptional regulator [Aestuariibacter halophilus]